MFVCVPEPVWKTLSGKWLFSFPVITSLAAFIMALAIFGSRLIYPKDALKGGMPLYKFIGNRVLGLGFPQQFDYLSIPVDQYLGEQLSPMGGWYIVADFVHYGVIGVPLLIAYNFMSWVITCKIFNTKSFPFGAFIFLIFIFMT